ncbi:hypothetical protein AC094_29530 [Bacteroides fragilis]|uniref:Transmembrane protein n=1 Tax=Bacteroides fragilis TaxID=817 RepID=A0A853PT46_BACFG|nr:hypothetical protein AC094_29530 [Bacteroides fragilis]
MKNRLKYFKKQCFYIYGHPKIFFATIFSTIFPVPFSPSISDYNRSPILTLNILH